MFIAFLYMFGIFEELKNSFYEELEEVFDHFPKYMKILLGD
jgi:hypothetical protein